MCPEKGVLQAYLDGELDVDLACQVADHLASCNACRDRLQRLEAHAAGTAAALEEYRQETALTGRAVWVPPVSQLPYRDRPVTETRRWGRMHQRHPGWAGVAASILALVVFLSWAPGRSLAAQILGIFRLERIQVIDITPEDMAQLDRLLGGLGGNLDIKHFGRVEVKPPAEPLIAADPSRVEVLSGLTLDLPATLDGRPRVALVVEQSPVITFAPDVEALNRYLSRHSLVLLPPTLAGQSVTINLPPLVRVQYGATGQGFVLYAARDLTISVPQGVDAAALRQALLRLPFLPENLRRQLAAIEDWMHTLPIPVAQPLVSRPLTVHGHQGVYFVDPGDDRGNVLLAWRQGDGWRAISGLPLEAALRVAAGVR